MLSLEAKIGEGTMITENDTGRRYYVVKKHHSIEKRKRNQEALVGIVYPDSTLDEVVLKVDRNHYITDDFCISISQKRGGRFLVHHGEKEKYLINRMSEFPQKVKRVVPYAK